MTAPYPPVRGDEPCRSTHPDVFFPETGRNVDAQTAANLCRDCPILLPCLAWAVEHEKHGIWGGTTPDQRKALRRMSRAA